RLALVLQGGEQEELGGDELVAALCRFLVGEVEEVIQVAGNRDLAALPFDLRQAPDRILQVLAKAAHGDPRALEERGRSAILLAEEREQQVLRLDEAVVV